MGGEMAEDGALSVVALWQCGYNCESGNQPALPARLAFIDFVVYSTGSLLRLLGTENRDR